MNRDAAPSIRETAIQWHIRLRDGDDADWEKFGEWLALDPRHADVYDDIESLDDDLDPLLPHLGMPASGPLPLRRRKRGSGLRLAASAGLAATVAAGVITVFHAQPVRPRLLATRAGEQRTVSLVDGTSIRLNGSTRIELAGGSTRTARLLQGQALFRVAHDDRRPFSVSVGDVRIVDIGTVFDVAVTGRDLTVGVAEGSVMYSEKADRQVVERGQELVRDPNGGGRVRHVSPDAIGAWRSRRLVYAATPLSRVAIDLSRLLGVRITVTPTIADRPFSGSLVVPAETQAARLKLQIALDVDLSEGLGSWSMKPSSGSR